MGNPGAGSVPVRVGSITLLGGAHAESPVARHGPAAHWQDAPSNALELAIFLEADRMGGLLKTMSPEKVDGQRDVVKNERRQSYENRPYEMAEIAISELLYPPGHPYHWPTIGSMADLSAASYEDVVEIFRTYYAPNNASVVIAGDIDPVKTRGFVDKWFGPIPRDKPVPPIDPPVAMLTEEKRSVIEEKVQLPRIYMNWLSAAAFAPGDAEMDLVAGCWPGGRIHASDGRHWSAAPHIYRYKKGRHAYRAQF